MGHEKEKEWRKKEFHLPQELSMMPSPSRMKTVSLNECLATGPPLQNSLRDIFTRSRFRPILDMALLQITKTRI